MVGVSTVVAAGIIGWSLYKAYSIATSDSGGRDGWKAYMKCYGIFGFGSLIALIAAFPAGINGNFMTAIANMGVVVLAMPFLGMIVLGDLGQDTAKYMKDNPEEAKEALDQAAQIANTAAKVDEKRRERKRKKEKKQQREKQRKKAEKANQERQQRKKEIEKKVQQEAHLWQMRCPKCNLAWGLSGSTTFTGAEAIGMKVIGIDTTLDMAEVQCLDSDCLNTRRVRVDQMEEWKKAR
ncbi:hypothetical protein [Halorubrum sp. N11]|uniref:hypothetical protein n=1 Tax=Halorubrum sp. N11 TaxID=3402276 RepID=UPI003EB80CF2